MKARVLLGWVLAVFVAAQAGAVRAQDTLSDMPSDAQYLEYGADGPFGSRSSRSPFGTGGLVLSFPTIARIAEYPSSPPTPEVDVWVKTLLPRENWTLARTESRGAVFVRPPEVVGSSGNVRQAFRVEFFNPQKRGAREFRSALAELSIHCGTLWFTGRMTGYAGQNLTGRAIELPSAAATFEMVDGKGELQSASVSLLQLTPTSLVRGQCAEAYRSRTAAYGPEWRGVLYDSDSLRMITGDTDLGLAGRLALTFRIEARQPQSDGAGVWRSAEVKARVDCVNSGIDYDVVAYGDSNLTGTRLVLPTIKALQVVDGSGRSMLAWQPDYGSGRSKLPGETVIRQLLYWRLAFDQCNAALARAQVAIETPGSPLRTEAEAWAAKSLTLKGWSKPIWEPEQVTLVSEAIDRLPNGHRVIQVRTEYFRPLGGGSEDAISGTTSAVQIDCAAKAYRMVATWAYAKPDQKDQVAYGQKLDAPWNRFGSEGRMAEELAAVCAAS